MRRWGTGFGLLAVTLFALTGCKKEPYLRPPKPPEQLLTPPAEEARFSQPPDYPKNVLNEDRIRKPTGADKDANTPGSLPRKPAIPVATSTATSQSAIRASKPRSNRSKVSGPGAMKNTKIQIGQ